MGLVVLHYDERRCVMAFFKIELTETVNMMKTVYVEADSEDEAREFAGDRTCWLAEEDDDPHTEDPFLEIDAVAEMSEDEQGAACFLTRCAKCWQFFAVTSDAQHICQTDKTS